MRERTAQEIVDAMKTGQLPEGVPLNPAPKENTTGVLSGEPKVKGPEQPQQPAEQAAQGAEKAPPEKPKVPRPKKVAAPKPKEEPSKEEKPSEEPQAEPPGKKPTSAGKKTGAKKEGNYVVSPRLTRFILNYINSSEENQARTVDIGEAGLHSSEAVRNPMPAGDSYPTPRYTAWACTPCTRLAQLGLIERVLVGSKQDKGRSMIVFYRITAAGTTWLDQDKAKAAPAA